MSRKSLMMSSSLRVEALEAREAPTITPWAVEPFDSPVGQLPRGWSQWTSNGETAFSVSTARPLRGEGGLAMKANPSNLVARTWLDALVPSDSQVQVAVFLDSLIPTQVLARGRALDSATPTYYALSVSRGLEAQLLKVENGVTTPLGSLWSKSWISQKWVIATLEVQGKTVRGQIYRPDTGQYLNAQGLWQSTAAWALEVADTSIGGPGQAGIGRPRSYAGTVTMDDFAVLVDADPSESFDRVTTGLPPGWSQWSSNGGTAASATPGRSVSAPNGLVVYGPSSTTAARAWSSASLTDAQVAASVYVDSLVPAQVFGRGQGLDGPAPSYYAVAVSRGMQTQLVRVQNGVSTVLGTVNTRDWTTDLWVRLTLFVNGTNVRAQVFRPDRAQYLNNTGRWQDTPTWAINLTDSALSGPGRAGVVRPASYVGSITFDDFSAIPAVGDSEAPTVRITSPAAGAALTGVTRVTATATDNLGVVRVEFLVDGALRAVSTTGPYAWDFDTRTLLNGTHTLDVIAYDAFGNVARAAVVVTTANDQSVPDPALPRHYSHIRIAQLAYRGNPLGALEAKLLQESVDLVIADPALLAGLRALAPATPRLAYTNASNLYLDRLTDWLAFADARGASRESAFYHVAKATAFSGGSPSSQPVTWFWNVSRSSAGRWTDLTSLVRGTSSQGAAFGALGESLVVGYPEKFREINLSLLSPPQLGWAAVLEYPTQVDDAGNPTAWAPLSLLSDGTFGLRFTGQMTFDPPANWQPASVNGSARLYYVRWRTTASGTAPVARGILGRDYVQARGTSAGVIPAFDADADLNRDGYLDNGEYLRRAAGKDARFVYEGRAFHGTYGQMRFAANPSDPTFRAWAIDYHKRLAQGLPLADGFFMDNSEGMARVPASVQESIDAFATDYASLLFDIGRALSPRWIMANTAGGGQTADVVVRRTTASYEEFLIRPLQHTWGQFEEVAQITRRYAFRTPAPYMVFDSLPTGGSPTDPRTQLATLAYYYLLGDPDRTFLNFYGGYEPASSWSRHWAPAAAFDIGRPTGNWSLFASGTDPANAARSYRIYQRNYGNALVLYKPLSSGSGSASLGAETTTTHALNGSYRPLQADGTLGVPLTTISLRNGEGAILVRA